MGQLLCKSDSARLHRSHFGGPCREKTSAPGSSTPEDLERLREERQVAFARGKPFELEQRALGKDGNYRWFLARFNPLRDDQGNIIRW